jgi:tripartite-type tricarboxylate transporter receptor subunit TctC
MTFVSYRSPASALSDLTAGQIQVSLAPLGGALPQLTSGKIKLLATMNPKRAVAVPAVPTAAEEGHPELTVEAQLGFFGQRTLAAAVREQIAADIRRLAKDSAMIERLRGVGLEACGSTPGEYAASLDDQRIRWAALDRAYGVRAAR